MKNLWFSILSILISFSSCAKSPTVTNVFSPEYRWMDRTLYFAYSNASYPERNNEFQKSKVKEAITEIQNKTSLGQGYFNFQEVDESVLTPSLTSTVSVSEFKSFILIWPDADFSDFVVNQLGGNIPDPNAVTVLNAAYKRKFYIIIKSSCFVSSSACNSITSSTGLRALIARQLGLMTGLVAKDCATSPDDVMCASLPKDTQWNPTNKEMWIAGFNNVLEAILNNPSFYKEYQPPVSQ